jgi:hypothetical protein
MKKSTLTILVIAGAILVAGIILLSILDKRDKNHFDFKPTMVVKNYTEYKGFDTTTYVVCSELFAYDTLNVNLFYSHAGMTIHDMPLYGFILQIPYKPHTYNIYISRDAANAEEVLIHELIHLRQYEDGDLIIASPSFAIYKGDTIYYKKVPYENRKYEKDAYRETEQVRKNLYHLLYK